ncbi:uncharacterized protein N7498_007698 [Penicillium cinerascens]|uniref:Uncharacterized protein n=1 Tax=Penicillium cinerascens TaxID=70096 RepID=A0A9W9MD03_9EURO|nr:uncharacterized protein N7498_007698 [Penicillium cinerascens]KAJ5198581.1 hypothetical protein N7498_007698 [Penicillium cinerascens]
MTTQENELFRQLAAKTKLSLATKVLGAVVTGSETRPAVAWQPRPTRSRSSTVDICPVARLFFNGFTKLVRSSEHLNVSEPAVA